MILSLAIPVRSEPVPTWFREGVFVEFRFDGFPVVSYVGSGTGYGVHIGSDPGFLRWCVLDFDGKIARMNISLYRDWSRVLVCSAVFHVNVSSRMVSLLDGTPTGVTCLWLPAFLKKDDVVPMIGEGSSVILGRAGCDEPGPGKTCQGYQQSFFVRTVNYDSINGTFNPRYTEGAFDEDTGILDGGHLQFDGALTAMNIEWMAGSWWIGDTNVDLGPRVLTSEILAFLFNDAPFTIPFIVFGSVLSVVMLRRRRKRRQRNAGIRTSKDLSA
jgi:hypothetical protein